MSTYPVLNDQPIDQWKVTELKDELCRRNLPISGLKEDLVKRLFEDLHGDGIIGGEGTANGSSFDDDLKEDEATGSADPSVCQAAMEPSVDEDPSLVAMQSGDLVFSVTEVSKESAVATGNVSLKFVVTEEVSQKTLAAAEVSDAPLVDAVATDKISPTGAVATKQDDLESVPSDSTMVKDVHEQAGGPSEFIAEKALEEEAGKKTIFDYQFATTDIMFDVTPAKGKLDDDILEHGVVSSPPDAIVPHAEHLDVDAVAAALGHSVDTLIPKISLGDNDLMDCKDHEDSGRTSNACKVAISGPIDQTSGTLPMTMSTYPVLDNRPIDQWKVTELKDELSKRNLPIEGFKDDLVRRLFKDLEGDILDLKEDGTHGSADASVCQDVMEQNVDEGPSQVATQEGDPSVSVTEASEESADAAKDISQVAVVTTEEVNQTTPVAATDSDAPLVDSATADKISLSVDEDLSLVSTQNGDIFVSVTEASKESAVATGNVSQKFVVTEEVSQKTLAAAEVSDAPLVGALATDKISVSGAVATKQDDLESAPSDSTVVKDVHEQAGAHSEFIAEKALEEDAGTKTIIDHLFATTDVKLDVTPAKGKLDDILEHEVVSSPPDAIVSHAEHCDVDAVATALGHNVDALIPKISSGDNDLLNCKDHKDSARTSNACKLTISGPIDQTSGTLPTTMPTYPVLNNRPIDQWKVTELKDELSNRNLLIKGLKDDLVRRLFKDLEGDILGGSPRSYDLKEDGTHVKEQNVDEGPSQPATQEGDPSVSVTEASKESADAGTDISQDAVLTNEEANQTTLVAATVSDAPLVDSATADKISRSDAVATKGDGLESAPSDSTLVKGASLKADFQSEIIAEKVPEEGTVKEAIVNYLPYDVASSNVKLDAFSAKGKLDADIVEKEAVLSPTDVIALYTDQLDARAIATALGQNADTLNYKIDLGKNAFMIGKDREDSERTNDDCKLSLPGKKDQVSEANPDIGSQIKCALILHEDISTNVKGDLNADNSDLELVAKRDMVKPACSIPSVGDDLRALDDGEELSKKGTPLQEITSTTNMNLDKKEDSPNGLSPEKLNLKRTSGNESTEEDVMESKHVIPKIRSDDLGRETEVTSDHEVKEVMLFDSVDSSVQTNDNVAKEKTLTPSEKRKPEDQVVAVEPIKRQCRVDIVKLPKEQTFKSSSDFPKDVVQPALKCPFGLSGSMASGESHRERIVPLPQKPATTSLRIDRFVRPFTLKAVQELLGRTGSICSFWMDHIRTHCYVTYSSVDEAVATRNAVYNLQWPLNNGNYLVSEFVDPHEVKLKLEHPPPPPAPINLRNDTTPETAGFQQSKDNQTLLPGGAGTLRGLLPIPQPLKLFPASKPWSDREMLPPPPKEPETPAKTLDDLFKRTQASPMIYYLPLSEEEVAAKLAARRKRKTGW